jgi:hypothetical protein
LQEGGCGGGEAAVRLQVLDITRLKKRNGMVVALDGLRPLSATELVAMPRNEDTAPPVSVLARASLFTGASCSIVPEPK